MLIVALLAPLACAPERSVPAPPVRASAAVSVNAAPISADEQAAFQEVNLIAPIPAVIATRVDEHAWVDQLAKDFPGRLVPSLAKVDLNRDAETPIAKAIGFNVPAAHAPVGFVWNDGDRQVDEWFPQGVGGFERDGRHWLVVTWYAKANPEAASDAPSYRGARLSLIDVTDPAHVSYRHALLVQDARLTGDKQLFRLGAAAKAAYTQGARFAPVPIHAGGVEVYQHWVYVVDTQLGVRQFDLDRLFTAEADPGKDRCGVVDGKSYAFDYRYILPEVAHYQLDGAAPYSCLSLDPATRTLWLGQYLADEDAARSAITGIPLEADGRLAPEASAMTFPRDSDGGYAHRIQGAFRQGRRTWLSVTGQSLYEGSTARLVMYEDGAKTGARWRWPQGAEDLYYDAGRDTLWSLTEAPKSSLTRRDRCVFGVRLGSYQGP
ncbi:MAG: hypothetical protein JWM80_3021 [Cyanobacteria bacterium RYN_339]|nr:hypothetical protein [Cyanobacteria bacterium RYN_339]